MSEQTLERWKRPGHVNVSGEGHSMQNGWPAWERARPAGGKASRSGQPTCSREWGEIKPETEAGPNILGFQGMVSSVGCVCTLCHGRPRRSSETQPDSRFRKSTLVLSADLPTEEMTGMRPRVQPLQGCRWTVAVPSGWTAAAATVNPVSSPKYVSVLFPTIRSMISLDLNYFVISSTKLHLGKRSS